MSDKKKAIKLSTLENIGNAVRNKEGTTDLIPVNTLADRIAALPSPTENKLPQLASGTLTELTAENLSGATEIKAFAFYRNGSLVNISMPDSVTKIGESAFSNSTKIQSVTIGKGVKRIEKQAFSSCKNKFTTLSFSEDSSCEYIGDDAFVYCTSILKLTLPRGLKTLGEQAFAELWQASEIILPDTLESIGKQAFAGCDKVKSIVIPDSVTTTGDYCFAYCNTLAEVTIGKNVTNLKGAFAGTAITSIVVPDNVTNISFFCQGCHNLVSVTIGSGVTQEIAQYTFLDCESLENLTIASPISATITFQGSYNLTIDSLKNIINALVDYYGTDEDGKYTLTLNSSCLATLDTEGATAPDGLTWSEYVWAKGWNLA